MRWWWGAGVKETFSRRLLAIRDMFFEGLKLDDKSCRVRALPHGRVQL